MKKIPLVISSILLAIVFSFLVGVHADDAELPFETDGVTYAYLNDAIAASVSGTIHVIHTAETQDVTIPAGKTLIIDNGVTLYCRTGSSSKAFAVRGTMIQYGNIVTDGYIQVSNGLVNLYGDTYAPNGTAFLVTSTSSMYFNGSIITAHGDAVHLQSGALGSNMVVNGGSFYSETKDNPISPLDSFSFDDGVSIEIRNGVVVVISNDTILSSVSRMVGASTNWISIFIAAILSQALLTLICIVAFVGLGLGLIKRIKR